MSKVDIMQYKIHNKILIFSELQENVPLTNAHMLTWLQVHDIKLITKSGELREITVLTTTMMMTVRERNRMSVWNTCWEWGDKKRWGTLVIEKLHG